LQKEEPGNKKCVSSEEKALIRLNIRMPALYHTHLTEKSRVVTPCKSCCPGEIHQGTIGVEVGIR
jgi:hypothetical protein